MPSIGEIQRGKNLGFNSTNSFIWVGCTMCNKPRWVALRHGKPRSLKCLACALKGYRCIPNALSQGTLEKPTIGDIRWGDELGYKNTDKFIFVACPVCKKQRWVHKSHFDRHCKKGICLQCSSPSSHLPGKVHPSWKGGHIQTTAGYILIYLLPNDPFFPMAKYKTKNRGYVLEHRLVMAKHLGRCLHSWEVVHHKHTKYPKGSIEDKRDNRIANLALQTAGQHQGVTLLENRMQYLENELDKLKQTSNQQTQLIGLLLWHIKELNESQLARLE